MTEHYMKVLFNELPTSIKIRFKAFLSKVVYQRNNSINPVLSDEQMSVFNKIENTETHMFITGKAGTGKSVLLRYFAMHTKKVIVKAAPTGIAALNIQGQTIHSLFRLPINVIDNKHINVTDDTRNILRCVDVIVIDEISMVRADIIDAIDQIMRTVKGNQMSFGGAQIVVFGDVYQLPPIVIGMELQKYFLTKYGSAYFFNATVWKSAKLITYELQTIFRQSDEEFKGILNRIRNGTHSESTLEKLNNRVLRPDCIPANVITLTSTNKLAYKINEARLSELRGKLRIYQAIIIGNVSMSALPIDEKLTVRVGARVIFTKNDPNNKWVNGTTGIIKSLTDDYIRVVSGKTVYDVRPSVWTLESYVYDKKLENIKQESIGSITQFPLKLAWAITIHKSQGCTYDKVAIDVSHGTFAHGQMYVALSRCRSLSGLYLYKNIKPNDITIDPIVTNFMNDKYAQK